MGISKIYIAGKITGDPDFEEKFKEAENNLRAKGHIVMNPARMSPGFTHEEYMKVCYAMIDQCNLVALLPDWEDSKGARLEEEYAIRKNTLVLPIRTILKREKIWK